MKKGKTYKIIAVVLLLVALAIGGWFVYGLYTKDTRTVEVHENQANIEVKNGQEFTIVLNSNPSTGYSWSISDTYDKSIVQAIGNVFKPSSTKKIGAPGEELWTFKGAGRGNTKINFTYSRKWEGKSSQETLKNFSLTVK